jgi:hypothetical protein
VLEQRSDRNPHVRCKSSSIAIPPRMAQGIPKGNEFLCLFIAFFH